MGNAARSKRIGNDLAGKIEQMPRSYSTHCNRALSRRSDLTSDLPHTSIDGTQVPLRHGEIRVEIPRQPSTSRKHQRRKMSDPFTIEPSASLGSELTQPASPSSRSGPAASPLRTDAQKVPRLGAMKVPSLPSDSSTSKSRVSPLTSFRRFVPPQVSMELSASRAVNENPASSPLTYLQPIAYQPGQKQDDVDEPVERSQYMPSAPSAPGLCDSDMPMNAKHWTSQKKILATIVPVLSVCFM